MKILLVSVKSEKSRGGIAIWTDRYLDGCAKRGIACRLVNTELVGKRAYRGTAHRSLLDEFHRTKRILSDLNCILHDEGDFDAAHLNTSCGTFGIFRDCLIAQIIKRKGIRLVTHFHCDVPFWIHTRWSRLALEKLTKLSDCNLVLCENSRRYLAEFGVQPIKIPNFIDESMILGEKKKIREKIERILFVGRVEESKGAAEIYTLARRFPEIEFELIGDVADGVSDWEQPENVCLLGGKPHEQVIEHLDNADVFLLPSHSEGFPVALVESMARGVPAIATDVGANADMLADGCGVIVRKGDVDAMMQGVQALTECGVRRSVSCKAVNKVRQAYTTDTVMKLLESSYLPV